MAADPIVVLLQLIELLQSDCIYRVMIDLLAMGDSYRLFWYIVRLILHFNPVINQFLNYIVEKLQFIMKRDQR